MTKTEIEDIYNGDIVSAWEDNKLVYIAFPWVTVSFPKEVWENVKDELREMINVDMKEAVAE